MSDLRAANNQQVNAQSLRSPSGEGSVKKAGDKLPEAVAEEATVNPLTTPNENAKAAYGIQQQKGEEEPKELESAIAQINDYLQSDERNLDFQIDDDAGVTVIRVYDSQTQELIRQIPNEEMLKLAQKLNKEEPLSLFSAQV